MSHVTIPVTGPGITGVASHPRESILREADRIVDGARQADYGPPERNCADIAARWTLTLADLLRPGVSIPADRVPLCMIDLKMVRELSRPKRDNRVDIAGYAKLLDLLYVDADDRPTGDVQPLRDEDR